jgi:hypothetical protein
VRVLRDRFIKKFPHIVHGFRDRLLLTLTIAFPVIYMQLLQGAEVDAAADPGFPQGAYGREDGVELTGRRSGTLVLGMCIHTR